MHDVVHLRQNRIHFFSFFSFFIYTTLSCTTVSSVTYKHPNRPFHRIVSRSVCYYCCLSRRSPLVSLSTTSLVLKYRYGHRSSYQSPCLPPQRPSYWRCALYLHECPPHRCSRRFLQHPSLCIHLWSPVPFRRGGP